DRTEPLSTARERLEAANEAVDALTQRLDALQRQARDGLLLAPFAGSVAEIRVGVGEQVAPGQAVAVYYAASAPIVVEGKLPAALAPKTHLHQSAFVHFAALESLTVRGRVIALGAMAYEDESFALTLALPSPLDRRVESGM